MTSNQVNESSDRSLPEWDRRARSIRLDSSTHTVDDARAMLDDLWSEASDVDAIDRASVHDAIVELVSRALQPSRIGPAVVCSLLVVVQADRIESIITDNGEPVDGEPAGAHPEGSLPQSGHASASLSSLADIVRYRRRGSVNEWTIVRAREHARAYPTTTTSKSPQRSVAYELARQQALDEIGVIDTPPEERFDRITRLAVALFGVTNSAVNLIDRERAWSKSLAGPGGREVARSHSMCNVTITGDEALVVPDLLADPEFASLVDSRATSFYAGFPLYAPNGERVGALCVYDPLPRDFSARDTATLKDLAALVQNELAVSRERARAAAVQRRYLPKRTFRIPGWSIAGLSAPHSSVGGDFYDWRVVGDSLVFTLADAVGGDAAASLNAATVRAALRSVSPHVDLPEAVAAATDALAIELSDAETFVTAFHARVDIGTGRLSYVDAGHGLGLVARRDGTLHQLEPTSPPLGVAHSVPWSQRTHTVQEGDCVIVVSDGMLEVFGGGVDALDRMGSMAASTPDPQEFVEGLRRRLWATAGHDASALVVRRDEAA